MKYLHYLLGALALVSSSYNFALAQPNVPAGRAVTINEIITLASDFTNYLYTIGIVIVGIALVWSGIIYTTAGGDSAKVNKAKGILFGALIGAFIIFASGAIISTISNLASNPGGFFGGGGGGGGGGSQAYGCSCVNGFLNCVPQAGGAYSDPTCYGACNGTVGC